VRLCACACVRIHVYVCFKHTSTKLPGAPTAHSQSTNSSALLASPSTFPTATRIDPPEEEEKEAGGGEEGEEGGGEGVVAGGGATDVLPLEGGSGSARKDNEPPSPRLCAL